MSIHKQIHIRLTSSFDKWLQMASIQGEYSSLQSDTIFVNLAVFFLYFFFHYSFLSYKNV